MVSYDPEINGDVGPQSKLTIALNVVLSDEESFDAVALVDTGAEVNLIRRGLVEENFFSQKSTPPKACSGQL